MPVPGSTGSEGRQMKRKISFPPFLFPWLISFLVTWGAGTCLITAFDLADLSAGGLVTTFDQADLSGENLFWFSLVLSGVFSLAMAYRFRWWIPILLAGGFLFLLPMAAGVKEVSLLSSTESLLYQISLDFNRTYHWGVIRWSSRPPSASLFPALLLVMGLICLTVSVTVCGRRRTTGAVLLGLIPLLLCMIARDTVPEAWCLWLLLTGLGLLILTGSSRRMDAQAGRRFTAMVLIPTILATTVLFWLVPASGYDGSGFSQQIVSWVQALPFWSSVSVGGTNFTGDTALPEVDLSDLGDRVDSPALAMTVVATHSGRLYLRGRGYDYYDGKTWTATTDGSGTDSGWSSPKDGYLYSVTVTTTSPRQQLYFPGNPGVNLQGKAFMKGFLPNYGSELEYTFQYGIPREDAPGRIDDRDYLTLPISAKTGMEDHLKTVLLGIDPEDINAVVQSIESYVEACAEYSYVPSRMPETAPDFATWFLENAAYGYCVHYATAAAVLLRAAGIPARYVTGYCVDVRANRSTDVWERHAHAWVEYYQPGLGWTILDATKGTPEPDPLPTEPPETAAPTENTTPTEPTETAPEMTQGPTTPSNVTERPDLPTQNATKPSTQTPSQAMPDWVKTAMIWLLSIAVAVVALWGQYRLRIWAKRRYLRRGSPNQRALSCYRLIRRRSRLLKTPIPERMTELAEKAKFSQHTLAKAELRELDGHLESLGTKLTRNSPLLRFLFAIE